jgi:hypothetical protein
MFVNPAGRSSIQPTEGKWLVAYFYDGVEEPLHYLGTPKCPAIFTENEAREEAARLNAETINMLQEDAFDGERLIYRYAAWKISSSIEVSDCDKISLILITVLEAAQAAGLPEERAEEIYTDIVERFEAMGDGFTQAFLRQIFAITSHEKYMSLKNEECRRAIDTE